MIKYAPEELREKREQYEKNDKRRSYYMLLLLILVEILYLYMVKGSVHSFWGVVAVILGALFIVAIIFLAYPCIYKCTPFFGLFKRTEKSRG